MNNVTRPHFKRKRYDPTNKERQRRFQEKKRAEKQAEKAATQAQQGALQGAHDTGLTPPDNAPAATITLPDPVMSVCHALSSLADAIENVEPQQVLETLDAVTLLGFEDDARIVHSWLEQVFD